MGKDDNNLVNDEVRVRGISETKSSTITTHFPSMRQIYQNREIQKVQWFLDLFMKGRNVVKTTYLVRHIAVLVKRLTLA